MTRTGLDNLIADPEGFGLKGKLGLLCNQASVNWEYVHAADLINNAFPDRLTALFGPQHGIVGTEQDNMKETDHGMHPHLRIPVYSLYADGRSPSPSMLAEVDTVLVDLQDVGVRVYTFAATTLYMMQACATLNKKVVVLDRPNPIDGVHIEGNILKPEFASFVGPFPIPMRHGLTMGELMIFYNREFGINCDLKVIPLSGWERFMTFEETGLPWVLPSPNLPTVQSAVVYPGQVILEGTGLSEGRGTTKPFEIFGAPYIRPREVAAHIEEFALEGVVLQEFCFQPTFNKWAGEQCLGFHIHVKDRAVFKSYRFSLAVTATILKLYPEAFTWSAAPYEYVWDQAPFDVIVGDDLIRQELASRSIQDMEAQWVDALNRFDRVRCKHILY